MRNTLARVLHGIMHIYSEGDRSLPHANAERAGLKLQTYRLTSSFNHSLMVYYDSG